MSTVYSIYLVDRRGNSTRYTSKASRREAENRVTDLWLLFPSLKAIEVRKESRSAIRIGG